MRARVTLSGLAAVVSAAAVLTLAATAAGATNGRIAFQALVGRFPQVFTIKPDGSVLKRITHVPARDPGAEKPTWTPDGKTIAFDAAVPNGVNIFTTGADGARWRSCRWGSELSTAIRRTRPTERLSRSIKTSAPAGQRCTASSWQTPMAAAPAG